ncbi:MAG TPA: Crp/Fnr family transcriptional regulator [Terriglobales bacterium]
MVQKRVALRRTKLFGELSEAELAQIAKFANEKHFAAGTMLFIAGEHVTGLFVVVSGKIRTFQQNAEGREQVMHVDTTGATIGDVPVFDDGPYPASAIAEEDTEVLFIPKQDIRTFCLEHPRFALKALKLMAERVRKHAGLVRILSLHEVGQRLALFLIAEANKSKSSVSGVVTFRLELSNHEIATCIGSVRDVVSRALARLQQDKLIAIKKRQITIPDFEALEKYTKGP